MTGRTTRARLPRFVDASLDSADDRVRGAAQAIAERIGRNLGHVLLALHRGDQVNRDARVRLDRCGLGALGRRSGRIVLAGGLTSGRLGKIIREQCK